MYRPSDRSRTPRRRLRELLKGFRARLKPEDVGVQSVGRRRVPGLRREEVAELADLNALYYRRFERGETSISLGAFRRVCIALRLSTGECKQLALAAFPALSGILSSAVDGEDDDDARYIAVLRRMLREIADGGALSDIGQSVGRAVRDIAHGDRRVSTTPPAYGTETLSHLVSRASSRVASLLNADTVQAAPNKTKS